MRIASSMPVAVPYCRLWYTWRLVACQIMLTAVEAVLIIRGVILFLFPAHRPCTLH